MPTYEFQCPKCAKTIEEIRSFVQRYDDPPTCPKCREAMERVISGGAGFVLKGGCWASDGYRSQNGKDS